MSMDVSGLRFNGQRVALRYQTKRRVLHNDLYVTKDGATVKRATNPVSGKHWIVQVGTETQCIAL